ncbi:unnamed protein product [Euphydryas editha]|uniref:Reverse transcriptase domain-containing protein n=1 Tax=Euphydryas editha TaxID=104508 RepID=A0AAU9UL66_EUPED|nr:unnamed protein product [Euphydryas editha]
MNLTQSEKDHRLPGSYRPITLLSHIAKLFERLLLRRLAPHLPLREEPYAFHSSHSTTLGYLASELNNRHCTVGVFLNMEKAFDRVWHAGLLAKIIDTTAPPALVRVVASFLEGRSLYVSVEGVDTQPRSIRAGVPQGSCLSPRLHAAYTDDIPTLREHLRWEDGRATHRLLLAASAHSTRTGCRVEDLSEVPGVSLQPEAAHGFHRQPGATTFPASALRETYDHYTHTNDLMKRKIFTLAL